MPEVNFTPDPNGDDVSKEIDEKFREFSQQLAGLVDRFGYGEFLVVLHDPKNKGLFHSAVNANTLYMADALLKKAHRTTKSFMNNFVFNFRKN